MDHTPPRIVSLQPSATVILASVGAVDRIVACTEYCKDVCPEVSGNLIVQDSWTAQAEQIIAARPDLVIAAVPYQSAAVAEILKAGVRFLGLAPRTLADIYTDITLIAGAVGASDRGKRIITHMQREIAAAKTRNVRSPRPQVYCEEWGKPLIHSQPWVAELVAAAGGEFVGEPGSKTDAEAVLRADPEIMVMAWCGAADRVPLEKIIAARGWSRTRAARSGHVFCVSDELLNTPAPTLLRGLRALEAAIHPERGETPPGVRRMHRNLSPGQRAHH